MVIETVLVETPPPTFQALDALGRKARVFMGVVHLTVCALTVCALTVCVRFVCVCVSARVYVCRHVCMNCSCDYGHPG